MKRRKQEYNIKKTQKKMKTWSTTLSKSVRLVICRKYGERIGRPVIPLHAKTRSNRERGSSIDQ